MAPVISQLIPRFYKNYSTNSLFNSANTYEKTIVSVEYYNARHDDKMYFLPNCRYHIILKGDIKELLQNLDAFCFNNQHVDCLYALFKQIFGSKSCCQAMWAVHFNHQNRGVDRMPSIAKKSRKKKQKKILSTFQQTK